MKFCNIIFSVLLLGAFSCDSLLEIQPEGNISGDALNHVEGIQDALNGAYYNLAGIHDGSIGGELLGGDFILIPTLLAHYGGNGVREIGWESTDAPQYSVFVDNSAVPSINDRIAANWIRAYETISTVNNVLENVKNISNAEERNRIEGEATGIRGLLYFEMVRLWAEQYAENTKDLPALPLLLKPVLSVNDIRTVVYSSIEEVYDQAQQDLETASFLLQPFGKNRTGLSYYACQAYLTRLFMQKGEYAAAVDAAGNIINDNIYTLTPSPLDAFNNPMNSTEDIFAIQQTLSNNAGDRSAGIGLTAFYSSLSESGLGTFYIYQTSLFESSDPELAGFYANNPDFSNIDKRSSIGEGITPNTPSASINAAFYPSLTNRQDGLLSCSKYLSANHVIPVIRLAEIYLNRAESIFETDTLTIDGVALNDLNEVRARSGLEILQVSDFDSPGAFYDSIVVEKKRELLYEGTLLHDLRRRKSQRKDENVFIGTLLVRFNPLSKDFILPIPRAEQDIND